MSFFNFCQLSDYGDSFWHPHQVRHLLGEDGVEKKDQAGF